MFGIVTNSDTAETQNVSVFRMVFLMNPTQVKNAIGVFSNITTYKYISNIVTYEYHTRKNRDLFV